MLASVSSGPNLGRKQVLFFLTMEKARSSSALEWGIVKISLKAFQRRRKRRAFSAWSSICPIKLQNESNFKSPWSILHDSITWSGISLSWSNWYSLNSSVRESNSDVSSKGRRLGYLWKECRYTLTHLIETFKRNPINKLGSTWQMFKLWSKTKGHLVQVLQWKLFNLHCVKSVQIRSYFWSAFSCIWTEYRKIRTRNNPVFGHSSRSVKLSEFKKFKFKMSFKLNQLITNKRLWAK